MAYKGIDRAGFEDILTRNLSPTTPIRSAEFLRGRHRRLEEIRRALVQPGRHIFIHGDRGVGKTSLAQTAAFEHQSSDSAPLLIGCDASTTFYSFAGSLTKKLFAGDPTITKTVDSAKLGTNLKGISGEVARLVERGQMPSFNSVDDVAGALNFVASHHSKQPVVVVDEFERISRDEDRTLFADLIKQVGDQSVPVKFIFCGIGSSLEELLDAHHSCYRYLTAISLERLGYDPRLEIIDGVAKELSLTIDDTTRYRIATISDGFPHYVHLVTEKLLWEVFEDEKKISHMSPTHYTNAIKAAVTDIEPHLKANYEKATLKYKSDYETVLWAVADNHELKRRSSDIYTAYVRLAHAIGEEPLTRDRFNQRMNSLKKSSHGVVLKASRQGWYEFREAILRGYVRLRAEHRNVHLGSDHPLEIRRAIADQSELQVVYRSR